MDNKQVTAEWIAQQRAICNAATPGPWQWNVNEHSKNIKLVTSHSGQYYVMAFERWGMQGAQPIFQAYDRYDGPVRERGSQGMKKAIELSTWNQDYRHDDGTIDHPDAIFIVAASAGYRAALDALEAAYAEIERLTHDYAASAKRLIDEKARLTAERDAAIRDLKWLSNEYKFCTTCKLDNGNGVWDCNDERCDAENHYDWRGLCAENTDAPTGAGSEANYAER